MRRGLAIVVVAFAVTAPAAAAPKVDLMVVGRAAVLHAPAPVVVKRTTVRVQGRRCRLASATPLAALLRSRLDVGVRDYGSCGRRAADAGGLYVHSVEGERERGRGGGVYKIRRRAPSLGAADPAGRLRGGEQLLWFWCRFGADGCQRTLAVRPDATAAAPGGQLRVTVTAYDDDGNGVPSAGATVTLGSATATAGPDGVATLTVPAETGTLDVVATQAERVRSFPVEVTVA